MIVFAGRDSPHPRGWTPRHRLPQVQQRGFPAPAGMDPAASRRSRPPSGIPRTRGDGPRGPRAAGNVDEDSPHPRGWTPAVQQPHDDHEGFPAPAGMDRRLRGLHVDRSRIPRTRGDGPSDRDRSSRPAGDSPHPRGWTPRVLLSTGRLDGFPAPAGMDPMRRCRTCAAARIPRTRGDGPAFHAGRDRAAEDSPHPRGWTRHGTGAASAPCGFPAPAGMDLKRIGVGLPAGRIPRTRGDGPCVDCPVGYHWMDSPHPRGWTARVRLPEDALRGFPAPAGMDPGRTCWSAIGPRIPRTRGDGPRSA